MCHIIHCITLGLDLIQRLITYFFACFIFVVVYIALTAALIAGMTYGYKYYLAEYYTINSTLHAIRKISLDPMRPELAEFDTKHYKNLVDYYEHQATSTTEPAAASLRNIDNLNELPRLIENKLLSEAEMDRDRPTLDRNEDEDEVTAASDYRATLDSNKDKESVSDYPDTQDINEYVKKINWIESNDVTTVTKELIPKLVEFSGNSATNGNHDPLHIQETTRYLKYITTMMTDRWVPVATKEALKTKSTSKKQTKHVEENPHLRYLLPVNKLAATSTTRKQTGIKFFMDKLRSALIHDNIIRRTVEPEESNISNAPESKIVSILLKHLSTIRNEITTDAVVSNQTSTEGALSEYPKTSPMRVYESKLNLALSQQHDKEKEEEIVIV